LGVLVVSPALVDEPVTGFVEKNGMLTLVLGKRDEVRRLLQAHRRGDEMAIETGIGASMGAACGNPEAQAVADTMLLARRYMSRAAAWIY
jgi:hypothetical protein